MVRSAALMPLALLAGCSDMPRARSESEIRLLARNEMKAEMDMLRARISGLELRLHEVDGKATAAKLEAEITGNATDRLRDTVNTNADIANKNALKEMTAEGACGKEVWQEYQGGPLYYRNKECTEKDFRKN